MYRCLSISLSLSIYIYIYTLNNNSSTYNMYDTLRHLPHQRGALHRGGLARARPQDVAGGPADSIVHYMIY